MPHDKSGKVLSVGDRVTLEFEVKEVHAAEDYCNVTLVTPGEHGPANVVSTVVCNTKQTTKVSNQPVAPGVNADDLRVSDTQRPDPYLAPGGIGND